MLALTSLFVSCNDAIDITQDGQVTNPQDVFRTPTDIERGVFGIYSFLPGETQIDFDSVFTDEVAIGVANGGQGLSDGSYNYFMEAGNSYALSFWTSYYGVINRVNRMIASTDELLEQIQGVNTTEANANRKRLNKSKGELFALRAYANFKLFSYFTPDYTNPSGLSIMKLDFLQTDDYSKMIGRSTVKEIQDFIIEDLDKSTALFTEAAVPLGDYNYINQGVIDAIKTKLYSMVGDYDKVITYGEAVLANPSYNLANATQYSSYFNDADITREVIFQLKRVRGNASVASAWYSVNVSATGSAFFEMGRSLYNALDKLDPTKTGLAYQTSSGTVNTRADVRYTVNVLEGSTVATNYESLNQSDYQQKDVLLIGKYKGRRSQSLPLQNNIPIFRSADIYLAIAEARAAKGQLVSSVTDMEDLLIPGQETATVENILFTLKYNRVTDVSILSRPDITNAQSAWKAILDERRVEFAYEGHRYLDMKRLGAKAGVAGFERYSKDCAINSSCGNSPVPTGHKMTLPIPTREINANTAIKGQQNPGY